MEITVLNPIRILDLSPFVHKKLTLGCKTSINFAVECHKTQTEMFISSSSNTDYFNRSVSRSPSGTSSDARA
jgi:hypothetical protein